jgi:hypothetical protein
VSTASEVAGGPDSDDWEGASDVTELELTEELVAADMARCVLHGFSRAYPSGMDSSNR